MLNNKIKYQVVIGMLMSLLWIGCENFEEADQIQKKEPGTIMTEDQSQTASTFDAIGLERIVEHMENSSKALDQVSSLSTVLQLINIGYDWKRNEENSHPYLKGGESHTIGKILQRLVLNRFPGEAHEGLVEIIRDSEFLNEIITFFTQSDLISEEELTALHQAIQDEDIEALKLSIDKLYVQFIKHFGTYFHILSAWTPQEENGTKTYIFNHTGWNDGELSGIHEMVRTKVQIEKGNVVLKEETKPAELRVKTVELITELIKKYFGITGKRRSI